MARIKAIVIGPLGGHSAPMGDEGSEEEESKETPEEEADECRIAFDEVKDYFHIPSDDVEGAYDKIKHFIMLVSMKASEEIEHTDKPEEEKDY